MIFLKQHHLPAILIGATIPCKPKFNFSVNKHLAAAAFFIFSRIAPLLIVATLAVMYGLIKWKEGKEKEVQPLPLHVKEPVADTVTESTETTSPAEHQTKPLNIKKDEEKNLSTEPCPSIGENASERTVDKETIPPQKIWNPLFPATKAPVSWKDLCKHNNLHTHTFSKTPAHFLYQDIPVACMDFSHTNKQPGQAKQERHQKNQRNDEPGQGNSPIKRTTRQSWGKLVDTGRRDLAFKCSRDLSPDPVQQPQDEYNKSRFFFGSASRSASPSKTSYSPISQYRRDLSKLSQESKNRKNQIQKLEDQTKGLRELDRLTQQNSRRTQNRFRRTKASEQQKIELLRKQHAALSANQTPKQSDATLRRLSKLKDKNSMNNGNKNTGPAVNQLPTHPSNPGPHRASPLCDRPLKTGPAGNQSPTHSSDFGRHQPLPLGNRPPNTTSPQQIESQHGKSAPTGENQQPPPSRVNSITFTQDTEYVKAKKARKSR